MQQGAAFVVGGSGGLGAAICRKMAAEWEGIVVGYRGNRQAAETIAAEIGAAARAARVDLTDVATIESALGEAAARGRVGAIIHAGGVKIPQPYVSQIGEAQWAEVIEVELMGFTRLVRAGIGLFRKQGGGVFTAVTSFANVHFPPGDALSSTPKAAIEALCRAVAKEEGRYGIRANCVAPGIINAGLGAELQATLLNEEIWAAQRARTPLKRFGEAADVAAAVAFLSSDRASYITGQTIVVDGGLSL